MKKQSLKTYVHMFYYRKENPAGKYVLECICTLYLCYNNTQSMYE